MAKHDRLTVWTTGGLKIMLRARRAGGSVTIQDAENDPNIYVLTERAGDKAKTALREVRLAKHTVAVGISDRAHPSDPTGLGEHVDVERWDK